MIGSEDANIIESKLDPFLKAINSLFMRTNVFKDFTAKIKVIEASQSTQTASTSMTSLPTQHSNSNMSTIKEPRINFPEKFDSL